MKGIKAGRVGIKRTKHALCPSFDEELLVDPIDEILADLLNGILKNFKMPIQLWDGRNTKLGVACI